MQDWLRQKAEEVGAALSGREPQETVLATEKRRLPSGRS